jgi:hypothetical protein
MGDPVATPETLEQSLLDPVAFAALIVPAFIDAPGRQLDAASVRAELRKQVAEAVAGDLSRQEAMLAAQAAVLNTMFMVSMGHARGLLLSEPETGERLARIALRAQAQAVRAVEALAAMKRPQVEAREAAAAAPQLPLIRIDLGERDSSPTEKSGGTDHELRSNTSAPAPALRDDPPLAALDARYWAAVARRQG